MKNSTKKFIVSIANGALEDIVSTLEENRFEPSERGAGTAPDEGAIESCLDIILKLIQDTSEFTIEDGDLLTKQTLESVIKEIEENQETNTGDEFDCLTEIDTFIRDSGEQKYQYFNTVYQYQGTNVFISVEEQRAMLNNDWDTVSINVQLTEKKEITTFEWS